MASKRSKKPQAPLPLAEPEPEAEPAEEVELLPLPQQPLPLKKEERDLLAAELYVDIQQLEGTFDSYRKHVQELRDLHDGQIEPKWQPFSDASKVFIPLPRLVKDSAHARLWQTTFQQKEVAIVESSLQEGDVERLEGFRLHDALKAMERAINKLALDENELAIKEKVDAILHEITVSGSVVTRVAHEEEIIPNKLRYDAEGNITKVPDYIERDQVVIDPIPVESAVWDLTADSHELRFLAYSYVQSRAQMEITAKREKWYKDAFALVMASPDSQLSESLMDTIKREHIVPAMNETIQRTGAGWTLVEAYKKNHQIGKNTWADVVITFHKKTAQVLRVILFPYIHNQLPAVVVNYETVRNRPIGRGAIEPISSVSAGVNAIANQTINSATIRDNPGVICPENSAAAAKLENGWYPGIVLTEQRQGEIRTFEFANQGNTQANIALMDRLFQIAFQVAHVGPAQFGDVGASKRSPASLGLSIIQQGAELIDKIMNRFRVALGRILMQAFAIYWQTSPNKIRKAVGDEDFELISRLMNEVGIDSLRVTLAVTSATHSKELDRQNSLSTIQTVLAYEREVLGLVAQMEGSVDPKTGAQIPPRPIFNAVALEILKDTQTLMSKWLEAQPNVTDASTVLADAAGIFEDAQAAVSRVGDRLQQLQQSLGAQGQLAPFGEAIPPVPPGQIGPGAGAILP